MSVASWILRRTMVFQCKWNCMAAEVVVLSGTKFGHGAAVEMGDSADMSERKICRFNLSRISVSSMQASKK